MIKLTIYETFLSELVQNLRAVLHEIAEMPDFYVNEDFKAMLNAYNTYRDGQERIYNLEDHNDFLECVSNEYITIRQLRETSRCFGLLDYEGHFDFLTSEMVIKEIMEFAHRMCAYILSKPNVCPDFYQRFIADEFKCLDMD